MKFSEIIKERINEQIGEIQIKVGENDIQVGNDSKLISKILENFITQILVNYCREKKLKFIKNDIQNKYPDFIVYEKGSRQPTAIDIKTSYLMNKNKIHGFTLGTYRGYFRNRKDTKNTVLPYNKFRSHYCICLIYNRSQDGNGVEIIHTIVKPKWKLASRSTGSGNTCNIGSIRNLAVLLSKNSIFRSRKEFDEFWMTK